MRRDYILSMRKVPKKPLRLTWIERMRYCGAGRVQSEDTCYRVIWVGSPERSGLSVSSGRTINIQWWRSACSPFLEVAKGNKCPTVGVPSHESGVKARRMLITPRSGGLSIGYKSQAHARRPHLSHAEVTRTRYKERHHVSPQY